MHNPDHENPPRGQRYREPASAWPAVEAARTTAAGRDADAGDRDRSCPLADAGRRDGNAAALYSLTEGRRDPAPRLASPNAACVSPSPTCSNGLQKARRPRRSSKTFRSLRKDEGFRDLAELHGAPPQVVPISTKPVLANERLGQGFLLPGAFKVPAQGCGHDGFHVRRPAALDHAARLFGELVWNLGVDHGGHSVLRLRAATRILPVECLCHPKPGRAAG